MSTKITKELIEDIKAKTNIVDVISQYVPVEKKGKNYVCVCPFHDDTNPSMHISEEKQVYHCFVCGAGGGLFQFVSNMEHISREDAIIKLGNALGYDLKYSQQTFKIDESKKPYYDILKETILYGQFQLLVNNNIKKYLNNRHISEAQIAKFELGYDDGKLNYYLKEKGFNYDLMRDAYLIYDNIGDIQDVFKERVLFPIHDYYGNPVGFTARTVVNHSAKYINTSETEVYKKGNLLYNYHRIKQNTQQKLDRVYLVEGTMDVLAFDQAGVNECVASLGTAITPEQIQALKRLNCVIYVCFDGDRAGRDATYKFGLLALQHNLKFEIVAWDSAKDPDDYLKEFGQDQFLNAIVKTVSWVYFLFEYLKNKYNLDNYSDKKAYAKEMADNISQIKDEVERNSYFDVLLNITGFDYRNTVVKNNKVTQRVVNVQRSREDLIQLELLNQILLSKRACDIVRDSLGHLPNVTYDKIASKIVSLYYETTEIQVNMLFDLLDEDETTIVSNMINDELISKEFSEQLVYENVKVIKIYYLEQNKNTLITKMRSGDLLQSEKLEISQQIMLINQKINQLKEE